MDNAKMLWYRTLHFPIADEQMQGAVMDVFREAVPNLVNKVRLTSLPLNVFPPRPTHI